MKAPLTSLKYKSVRHTVIISVGPQSVVAQDREALQEMSGAWLSWALQHESTSAQNAAAWKE